MFKCVRLGIEIVSLKYNWIGAEEMKKLIQICLISAVLLLAAGQGFGIVYFNDGGMHNINHITNDNVDVDYQTPDMQTTVNLLAGGAIAPIGGVSSTAAYTLSAYNESRINISGGSMADLVVPTAAKNNVRRCSAWEFVCPRQQPSNNIRRRIVPCQRGVGYMLEAAAK